MVGDVRHLVAIVPAAVATLVACVGARTPAVDPAPLPTPAAVPSATISATPPAPPAIGGRCTEDEDYACAGPAFALLCRHGVYVSLPCGGPTGCSGSGATSHCDNSRGNLGDPCLLDLSDANYACTVDGTNEVVCAPESLSFQLARVCLGPSHCRTDGPRIFCDQSIGRIGDACAPEGRSACSEDGKAALRCSPGHRWTLESACHGGCQVQDREVQCK
jgi:hypothetical protein